MLISHRVLVESTVGNRDLNTKLICRLMPGIDDVFMLSKTDLPWDLTPHNRDLTTI